MKSINNSISQKHNRKYSTNSNHNLILSTQHYIYVNQSSILFNISILTSISKFHLQCLCYQQKFHQDETALHSSIDNTQNKEFQFLTMIIQKSNLQVVNHHNVKHTFDFLDQNIGQFQGQIDKIQGNKNLTQSVNHNKKYMNIKIQLPYNYKIFIKSIQKNIHIGQNYKNKQKLLTKVFKPIQLIQQTVKLRALKLSQSLRKDKSMQSSKKLNIQWGDTSLNNTYSTTKQNNYKNLKKTYINLVQRKNTLNTSTHRINGIQFKKSAQKINLSISQLSDNKSKYQQKKKISRQPSLSSSKSIKKKIQNQLQNQDQNYVYTNKSQNSNPFSNKKTNSFLEQSIKKPLQSSKIQQKVKLSSRTQQKNVVQNKIVKKVNQTQQHQIKKIFGKNISQNKIAQVSRVLHPSNI